MKNILYHILFIVVICGFTSCEKDNYEAPDCTIQGKLLDHKGNPFQTEQGKDNMRIKMEELSWAGDDEEIAIIPQYLNVKQEGEYINTKYFAGEYRMTPVEGPFYPYDEEGEIVQIKGTTTKDFVLTPYLELEWVKEPTVTADNFIEASVRFKRVEKAGEPMPDVLNGVLCISMTQYCGDRNKVDDIIGGTVPISNTQEGDVIEFRTSRDVKYTGMTYFVRVGICCDDNYKKYNYTDIKTVDVP